MLHGKYPSKALDIIEVKIESLFSRPFPNSVLFTFCGFHVQIQLKNLKCLEKKKTNEC